MKTSNKVPAALQREFSKNFCDNHLQTMFGRAPHCEIVICFLPTRVDAFSEIRRSIFINSNNQKDPRYPFKYLRAPLNITVPSYIKWYRDLFLIQFTFYCGDSTKDVKFNKLDTKQIKYILSIISTFITKKNIYENTITTKQRVVPDFYAI